MAKNKVHAHKLVAETASQMAGALYEELAKNNVWYKKNPDQQAFIRLMTPKLLEQARRVLAGMLASPAYADTVKADIFSALTKDATLKRGRDQVRH